MICDSFACVFQGCASFILRLDSVSFSVLVISMYVWRNQAFNLAFLGFFLFSESFFLIRNVKTVIIYCVRACVLLNQQLSF